MRILLGAIVPYAMTSVALLLFWRFFYRKHPYPRLLAAHLAVFASWHIANALVLKWQAGLPCGIEEWLAVAILYAAGIDFMLGNYTCIEGDTPSMMLFTLIAEKEPDGCSRDEAVDAFCKLGRVEERLDTMELHQLIERQPDGSFSATRAGRITRWLFDICFWPLHRREDDDKLVD